MCYQCKNTGHHTNDCPEKKDEAKLTTHPYTSKATTKRCYSCEEEGHYSRDCPIKRTRSAAFDIEYDWQEIEDLLALEESKKKRKLGINQHHSESKRDISQVLCFKCNNKGHYANKCLENMTEDDLSLVQCFKCKEMGHYSPSCPKEKKEQNHSRKRDITQVECYTFKSLGHYSWDYPEKKKSKINIPNWFQEWPVWTLKTLRP